MVNAICKIYFQVTDNHCIDFSFCSFYITRNGLNRTVASFDNKLELAQITLGLSNDTQSGQTQLQCMEGISNVSIKE